MYVYTVYWTSRVLARDQSASLEDWQKLARTGEIVWFYNGRDRKKTGKIVRNGHFGQAVSESWLNLCGQVMTAHFDITLVRRTSDIISLFRSL